MYKNLYIHDQTENMDPIRNAMDAFVVQLCGVIFASLSIYFLCRRFMNTKAKERYPPEPKGGWPIIGHLHLFGRRELLYRKLGAMADELGPAFVIRLGMRRALVVSNWEIAKECFNTHDKALATRPSTISSKLMGYNNAMLGIAPYGPYWREVRKIAMLELLSNHRLQMFKPIRVSEVDASMKELYELWRKKGSREPVVVEFSQWFKALTMNVMVRIIAGKRFSGPEDEELRMWEKVMSEMLYLGGTFVVSDAFPVLRGVDVQGVEGAMKKTAKEMDFLLSRWVEEHRNKKRISEDQGEQLDFMDVMLDVVKDGELYGVDADSTVKATCMALFGAGSDTTTVTLIWVLSLLLNNRHVLKRAQEELDSEIGRDRQVEEEDIKNLPYLQAIVTETARLYPALPLLIPHEAMENCTIAGFHVPIGTRVITNVWKLHRDPNMWPDPLEFRPERFLTTHAHVDFRGKHFELLPFGSGRRVCLGISFATSVMHVVLARLLHEFELGTPDDAPVDMTEGPGVTLTKASPLDVLVAPRLPSISY